MGWSQVVHENRKSAELQRAREDLRLRRRGHAIEERPSAGVPAVLTLAGVLTAAAWWRKEGRKVHGRDWRSLPGISQLLDFLQSGNTPKRTVTRSKSKPKTQLAPPGRAAAARQQAAGKTAGTGPARTSSSNSGGGGAAAAAAAAAVMRASGGGSSSGGAQQQQVAASSSAGGSQQSKAKKKKNKKKK